LAKQISEQALVSLKREELRLNAIKQEILAAQDYSYYVVYANDGEFIHHDDYTFMISNMLNTIARRERRIFACISLPPRHGKSLEITKTFPSFYHGLNPTHEVMLLSYAATMAEEYSRDNLVKFEKYGAKLFNMKLSRRSQAVSDWKAEGVSGAVRARGIEGATVGFGADLLIIDDPIKGAEQADSVVQMQHLIDAWEQNIQPRLHPDCSVIIIQTRWRENDLIGAVQKLYNSEKGDVAFNQFDDVLFWRLPCECDSEDDLLGRKIGDPLWSNKFGKEWIASKKITVGTRTWNAQYQGRPSSEKGNMVNPADFKYYDRVQDISSFQQVIQSWDCTFKGIEGKTKREADLIDYVVGTVWGKRDGQAYLLHVVRRKMGIVETIKSIETVSKMFPTAIAKYIEEKANGSAVIDMLKHRVGGMIANNPSKSKVERLNEVLPFIEAGNVWIPHPDLNPHTEDFLEEFKTFPLGEHDDIVDSTTQALSKLQLGVILNSSSNGIYGNYTPTELEDLGLNKYKVTKRNFKRRVIV